MNESCGCCEGIERVTPVSNENRPGLSALVYRAGTHASFLETMLARLTSHALPAPVADEEQTGGPRPLLQLKTRETEDASVALLDAWATVADVLTFYQERIANEGYLRTATERRSVIELANLLGYRPRPGVSASTYLAYTLEEKSEVTILAGSKAASTPGPGELPQVFETAEDLYARAEWNVLYPRMTRRPSPAKALNSAKPVYFKGTATNLKPNDPVLVVFGEGNLVPLLYRVTAVEPDQANDRTKVGLQLWTQGATTSTPSNTPAPPTTKQTLLKIATTYRAASNFGVNANTATAGRVLGYVDELMEGIDTSTDFDTLLLVELRKRLDKILPKLREEHRLAREGGFTKLEPWIGGLVVELDALYDTLPAPPVSGGAGGNFPSTAQPSGAQAGTKGAKPPPLASVLPLLAALTKEPAAQFRSKQQLPASLSKAFSPDSDNIVRLLGAFVPSLTDSLYRAWGSVALTAQTPATVFALRTRASVFGNNAPPEQLRDDKGVLTGFREWSLLQPSGTAQTGTYRIIIGNTTVVGSNTTMPLYTVAVTGPGGVSGQGKGVKPPDSDTFPITVMGPGPATIELVTVTVEDEGDFKPTRVITFDFRDRDLIVTVRVGPNGVDVRSEGSDPTRISHPAFFFNTTTAGTTITGELTVEGTVTAAGDLRPTESALTISLDATYNKILPGQWIAVERPRRNAGAGSPPEILVKRVERVGEGSRAAYGMAAKGTQVQLSPATGAWISADQDDFSVIRNTTVFVESEPLELADEPLEPLKEAVCGDSVELSELVAGLEVGRWLVITGERADVAVPTPDGATPAAVATRAGPPPGAMIIAPNPADVQGKKLANLSAGGGGGGNGNGNGATKEAVPGVTAAELVMLSGVEQSFAREKSDDNFIRGDVTHTTLRFAKELAYCYKRDTVRIYGNVVRATHGETRNEVLGSGDASKPLQSFTLRQSPLTYVSAPTASGVESTLKVRVNDVLWHEADSLAGLAPLDRMYVTRTNEDGTTTIVFGNGREGARIPTGAENVKAVYRSGIGRPGNLKAKQVNQPATKPLGVKEVVNPLAATGGADRESRDEARRNAPLAVMALDRLVSTQDYRDFALTFAGVARAKAARLSDGRRRVVHVTIAGADDAPISKNSDLYMNLREAMHRFGDPFQPIEVDTRYLKTLFMSANVKVHPDYLWENVEPKVRAALLERFSFDRRDLGQDALLSEAIAAAQSVEGVVYVDFDTFDDVAEGLSASELFSIGEGLRLRGRIHAFLAHVETAALVGQASRIRPAQLVMLTPLVPDTLILKEIKG